LRRAPPPIIVATTSGSRPHRSADAAGLCEALCQATEERCCRRGGTEEADHRCRRLLCSHHASKAAAPSPAMNSRLFVGRERSIVRADGDSVMTVFPPRLEARCLFGFQSASELGAPVASCRRHHAGASKCTSGPTTRRPRRSSDDHAFEWRTRSWMRARPLGRTILNAALEIVPHSSSAARRADNAAARTHDARAERRHRHMGRWRRGRRRRQRSCRNAVDVGKRRDPPAMRATYHIK
jgi:hypothetical protein